MTPALSDGRALSWCVRRWKWEEDKQAIAKLAITPKDMLASTLRCALSNSLSAAPAMCCQTG